MWPRRGSNIWSRRNTFGKTDRAIHVDEKQKEIKIKIIFKNSVEFLFRSMSRKAYCTSECVLLHGEALGNRLWGSSGARP